MNSVIFDGSKKDVGKIIKVNVEKANQNSLFGKTKNQRELLNWVILPKKNLNQT